MLALPQHSHLIHADGSWWTIHRPLPFDFALALLSPLGSQLRGRVVFCGLLLLRHEHAHRPLEYHVELIAILAYNAIMEMLPTDAYNVLARLEALVAEVLADENVIVLLNFGLLTEVPDLLDEGHEPLHLEGLPLLGRLFHDQGDVL